MSKMKSELKNQISEGVQDFEYKKNLRKKNSLSKEEFQKSGVHLTEKQNQLYKGIRNSILTVAHGPAGTSKTYTTCYTALALLADKKIEKIIITKPIQESGENLGFLPGSLEDKLNPYKQSYYTTFCKIIGKPTTDFLFSTEEIVFEPLAYMRGSTYDNCVMLLDECFTGDTRVVTNHKKRGSFNYLRIKEIVNYFKMGKEIYVSSWNENKKIVENKKVTGVFENGVKDIVKVYVRDRNKPLKTTMNHPFSVFRDGEIIWDEVKNLNIGDRICRYKNTGTNDSTILTNDSYDIILGMCLGDSSLLPNKQIKKSYRILTNHSIRQIEYMEFKKSIFENISSYRNSLKSGYTGEPQCGFQTKSINISENFYNSLYKDSKKTISNDIERWFTLRTLSIWYMDDGSVSKSSGCVTFSTNSMSYIEVQILSNIIKNKFGLESTVYKTNKGNILVLNKINSLKMFNLISKYIHPTMIYKLNNSLETNFDRSLYNITYNDNLSVVDIIDVQNSEPEVVYNIEVDGNHNYFVENILVHNCQNASIKQLMLWVTRLGKDSKAVMMGDTSQYDVRKKDSGYNDFIKMVGGMNDLCLFEFSNEDIVRNKFLVEIANRYDKYRSEQDI